MRRNAGGVRCLPGREGRTEAPPRGAAEIPAPWESLGEHLVRQRTPVLRYVTSILGQHAHLAEDITQETLLRAWVHAERLGWRERPVLPWLLRIARNLAVDTHRKERAIPVGIRAEAFADPPGPGADLAEVVTNRRLLLDAMARMPPAQREILVQVHLLSRGGEEVARILRIPPGTVKSRTHTAVRSLRAELALPELTGTEPA